MPQSSGEVKPHPAAHSETPVRVGASDATGSEGPKRVSSPAPSSPGVSSPAGGHRCPVYRWGQKEDRVQITLELPRTGAGNSSLSFDPGATALTFDRTALPEEKGAGGAVTHRLRLVLHDRVLVGDSSVEFTEREVVLTLVKADKGARWPALQKQGAPKAKACEKVDWDMWVDSDAESDDDDANAAAAGAGAGTEESIRRMFRQAKKAKKEADALAKASEPVFVRLWKWLPTRYIQLQDVLLAAVLLAHLFFAPLNKVEESFGTQAAHDLLYHGSDLAAYDHNSYPGVVPRTFAGPALLAAAVAPLKIVLSLGFGDNADTKWVVLYALRATLALFGAMSLSRLRRAVDLRFGTSTGWCFAFLLATQFHLMFYGSRLLPNTFALWPVVWATAFWLEERHERALGCLAVAASVFRCELAALIAPSALSMVLRREATIAGAVRAVALPAIIAVSVTAPVDSVLWGRPLWPELDVFWFNVVENRSGEYGTSAWHWYLSSALPRALLAALPLAPVGGYIERRRLGTVLYPFLAFVALYSLLPHKELRFVLYAVPILTVAASIAMNRVVSWSDKNEAYLWLTFAYVGAGAMAAAMFLTVSALNYPGGSALRQLHKLEDMHITTAQPYVYIDNAAAQTGVSLWLERLPPWRYSREEGLSAADLAPRKFTHLVTEHSKVPGYKQFFKVDRFVRARWSFPPVPEFKPYIYVHRREDLRALSRAEYEAREQEHTPPDAIHDHGEETYDGEL